MGDVSSRCGICGKEWTDNDLWEEIQEGVHKRCDKKLNKLSKLINTSKHRGTK